MHISYVLFHLESSLQKVQTGSTQKLDEIPLHNLTRLSRLSVHVTLLPLYGLQKYNVLNFFFFFSVNMTVANKW